MWLTDLEKLTDPKYGLTVRFENGWKRRGASGGAQMRDVCGVLWHHDVAPRKGTYPLRTMLREGRAGLSGPLCHIGFDRDGTVWVVGAGKANHAGKGIVRGIPRNGGNTRLIGIEMTSAGTKPWDWTPAQLAAMPLLGAALSDIFGLSSSQHWAHYEYSSTGKIDPAGLPGGMAGLRSRIAAVRIGNAVEQALDAARPWRTSPRIKGMDAGVVKSVQKLLGVTDDGIYGDKTGTAVAAVQAELGLTPDGVWGPATEVAMSKLEEKIDRAIAIVTENQRRINEVREQTSGIRRGGKDVSLRQEIADAKTLALSAEARDRAILESVQAAASSGTPVDLEAVTAAAERGVAAAVSGLTADVTLTVDKA